MGTRQGETICCMLREAGFSTKRLLFLLGLTEKSGGMKMKSCSARRDVFWLQQGCACIMYANSIRNLEANSCLQRLFQARIFASRAHLRSHSFILKFCGSDAASTTTRGRRRRRAIQVVCLGNVGERVTLLVQILLALPCGESWRVGDEHSSHPSE